MKKSDKLLLSAFFVFIPLTLFIGGRLPGRGYYITAAALIAELSVPLFASFKKGKPQARELAVLALMCLICIIGRVAIPVPNFKAAFALIMLTGISFGASAGYIVGAITAFVSNFFYGQGAYVPWQMMAYGAGGMLSGFAFYNGKIPKKPWILALFGFVGVVFFIGPLLDCSHMFLSMPQTGLKSLAASFVSGFPVNVSQGVCTAVIMLVFGKPIIEKLDRFKLKYGILEPENGI